MLFTVLHAANYTHLKERRMHFIIMNGVTAQLPPPMMHGHHHLPPQHQAVLHDQLMQIANTTGTMPMYNTNNSRRTMPVRHPSSAYLLNNSMHPVDEDHMGGKRVF